MDTLMNGMDLFLRMMGVLVLPLFFWWFNLKFEANHQRLKQVVDEASAITLTEAGRLIRRHNADLVRLKQLVDRLSTQVDLLFAKVERLEAELHVRSAVEGAALELARGTQSPSREW